MRRRRWEDSGVMRLWGHSGRGIVVGGGGGERREGGIGEEEDGDGVGRGEERRR